jgi:diguanylate cyclase (GGDEF)-like protein/PAS domain S-box-containing protein
MKVAVDRGSNGATVTGLHRLRVLASALEQIGEGVAVYDNDEVLIYGNRRFADMHDVAAGELEGRHMNDIVDLPAKVRTQRARDLVLGDISRQEFTWSSPIGVRTVQVSATNLRDDEGAKIGTAICILDVTDRKELEEQLRLAASQDLLTGLPNRRVFLDKLEQSLAVATRGAPGIGVLFIDLDGFKAVNDAHGHGVGDQLLRMIADRLKGCVRASDTLARLAGDEFVVLLVDLKLDGGGQANNTATRILDALTPPFVIGIQELTISASIGIALAEHGRARDILHAADSAMYEAKLAGPGRIATNTNVLTGTTSPAT